jgi:hypothetical protein
MELEQFVNKGLREGWTGWPLKVGACAENRLAGQWPAVPVRRWLCRRDGVVCPAGMEETFAMLHSLC